MTIKPSTNEINMPDQSSNSECANNNLFDEGQWYRDSILTVFVSFFFSSRRRHTRFDCDWSSDVCSSDLGADGTNHLICQGDERFRVLEFLSGWPFLVARVLRIPEPDARSPEIEARFVHLKIGRASCRERV